MLLSSKRAITKTMGALLIAVAVIAVLVPIDLLFSSLNQQPKSEPTPTPNIPITTSSPAPTPTPQSTPKKTSPTATPSPYPTSQPVSPTPSPTPTPSQSPLGNGPSTTEALNNESLSTVQSFLIGLAQDQKSTFSVNSANATLGNWTGNVVYSSLSWTANTKVSVGISLNVSQDLITEFKGYNLRIDNACVLITAERDFDSQGKQHVPWDNTVSTILSPAGLPIEGGGSAAISRYNGYTRKSPVDIMIETPFSGFVANENGWAAGSLYGSFNLPNNLPPGIYRLRFDFGFKAGTKYVDFNNATIGTRPTYLNSISCLYSPPIRASGWDQNNNWVDASQIVRKSYWDLLWDYYSNGYRGVISNEDQKLVAISPRSIIHDTVILPKTDINGNNISYNIEPNFLLDNDNTQRNIPMNFKTGQWTAKIIRPDGVIQNLGIANFTAKRGNGATTQNSSFTSWKPPVYGNYTIEAYGWIIDLWGNRYQGGGNYTFWIGNRLTVATATFQGMPYNVGNRYGRDLAFNPPVPANVTMKAQLFLNSDPNNLTTVVSSGVATMGGVWGAAQGMVPLPFTAPGEYFGTVTATYVDSNGVLWVASMTHAGVVYPTNSSIVAHGKKLQLLNGTLIDRGQTLTEGYTSAVKQYLQHINFPYNSSDVLEIASEFQGSNKIEPVLTYNNVTNPSPYNSGIQAIGHTNVVTKTSNNLSPEMFPEYITDLQYFYGAAAQPGFNARFIVAYDYTRAPYWPTSNTNFGGQYGASNNGDMPGTIYRLLGGVVLRNRNQSPLYAGYQASAFILPKGTNNNRIVGPGDENLPSPDNQSARFFMVPIRPGSTYPLGATFTPVLQIDPILPCNVTFTLISPDNITYVTTGQGDQYGYFASSKGTSLNQTGVWAYFINATWNGFQGHVPGLPETGGWIYVIESGSPPGPGISLNMPKQKTFTVASGLNVTGQTTASKVYYAVIIPGAVLEEGILQTTTNGSFTYFFNPQGMANKIQTYDIVNMVNGQAQIGKIVHLTFFSEEKTSDGSIYHSFARVVLRGTTAVYVKES